jgi:hypothetical protein
MSSSWAEVQDKKTGRTYYYNKATKETRWTKPEENETADAASNPANDEPSNWVSSTDKSSGRKYYYNKVTKETRWSKPPCFTGDADAAPLEASRQNNDEEDLGDPKKWKRVIDSKSGRAYYYNSETKQTSWKKPKGFDQANQSSADMFKDSGIEFPVKAAVKPADGPPKPAVPKAPLPANSPPKPAGKKSEAKEEDSDAEESPNEEGSDEEGADGDDKSKEKARKMLDDDEVDESTSGGTKFRFSKHRKGLMNRILHIGGAHDEKTLLSYKKSLIKKALLKQNREYDQEAVQSFKNIMSYMGDRKSHKSDVGHVKKLIQNGLTAPETLRDEIFLQICKQVTNHPNLSHAIKGWELMALLLGCFPPSVSMKPFLDEFLSTGVRDEANDAEIKRLAQMCQQRLEKIMIFGPRSEAPSSNEIKKDQSGGMLSLKVYTLDNAFRTVDADCFTQVKEIKKAVIQKLGLSYSVPFSLFEFSKENEERILDEEVRILDVVSAWERIAKEKKIAQIEPYRLVFKAELVLKTSDKNLIEDEEALNLMYMQSVFDVVNEKYPAEAKDCPSLAALHLQSSFGDYNASVHTIDWLSERLPELMPPTILNQGKKKNPAAVAEAAQKVLTKYTKLAGVSANEAKLSYLDYVQDWPLYGASFVTVEQKQLKDYPPYIKVAVTCDAILLVHPETMDVLDTFGYHEIVTWGYSDEKFILVVGNLVQQRKLFFKTNRGKFMNKLVHDYVKTKVPTS